MKWIYIQLGILLPLYVNLAVAVTSESNSIQRIRTTTHQQAQTMLSNHGDFVTKSRRYRHRSVEEKRDGDKDTDDKDKDDKEDDKDKDKDKYSAESQDDIIDLILKADASLSMSMSLPSLSPIIPDIPVVQPIPKPSPVVAPVPVSKPVTPVVAPVPVSKPTSPVVVPVPVSNPSPVLLPTPPVPVPITAPIAPSSGSCSSNPSCAALGLTGNCCPTLDGTYLDCCTSTIPSSPVVTPPTQPVSPTSPTPSAPSPVSVPNAPSSPVVIPPTSPIQPISPTSPGSCSANPQCSALGLIGPCCPTLDGTYLDCCGSQPSPNTSPVSVPTAPSSPVVTPPSTPTKPISPTSPGSCSANPQCAALGLIGPCCPTIDGTYLDCCGSQPTPNSPNTTPVIAPPPKPIGPPRAPVSSPDICPPAPSADEGLCSANPACAAKGLTGSCCPTSDGIFLDCCGSNPKPSIPSSPISTPVEAPIFFDESCSKNPGCIAAGLTGACCPDADGVILDCCYLTPTAPTATSPLPPPTKPTSTDGSCSSNPGCAALGLTGACCPTKEIVFLDCCGTTPTAPSPVTAPTKPTATGTCSSNSQCAKLNLVGDCCPTVDGVFLDCCKVAPSPVTAPSPSAPSKPIAPIAAGSCSSNPGCAALGLIGSCCPTADGVTLDCCSSKPAGGPIPAPTPTAPTNPTTPTSSSSGTCSSNPGCSALGLKGECCPTIDGVTLNCCSSKPAGGPIPAPAPITPTKPSSPTASSIGTCSSNSGCSALGLTGECCPTVDGVTLDCCQSKPSSPVTKPVPVPTKPISPTKPGLCSANPACAVLNLAGACCPTSDGVFLDCCNISGPSSPKSAPIVVVPTKPALVPSTATSRSCSSNSQCAALGLTGDCCPTVDGVTLDCCNAIPTSKPTTTSQLPPPNATCAVNPGCSILGLTGSCCPTITGVTLDCCDAKPAAPVPSPPTIPIKPAFSDTCSSNSKCAALGLKGHCCPTANGVTLDCCDKKSTSKPSQPPVQRTCKANTRCAALGLAGDCCPTPDGVVLDCCSSRPSAPISVPTVSSPSSSKRYCSSNPGCAALALTGFCCPTRDNVFLNCCQRS